MYISMTKLVNLKLTVVSRLDQVFGPHLVSLLRSPGGAITICISGPAFRHYALAEEDWYSMKPQNYDIHSRSFKSETELRDYLNKEII